MAIGYARVSTAAQDLAGQIERLKAAGCDPIYSEHASGAYRRRRPELMKAISRLGPGDVFMVVRMSRFARSSADAMTLIGEILDRGAHFRSLDEPWADTTTPAGRLIATIFIGFAEFDREQILERTAEGRAAARAQGVRMGRPPTLNGRQRRYARQAREQIPPVPFSVIASVLKTSVRTVKRAVAEPPDPAGASDAGEQIDIEQRIAAVEHAPACAVWTSGLGNPVRCTCGRESP